MGRNFVFPIHEPMNLEPGTYEIDNFDMLQTHHTSVEPLLLKIDNRVEKYMVVDYN